MPALSPFDPLSSTAQWKQLDWPHDIMPGSVLDFTSLLDGPAGKHGRLIICDGKFVFENRPETPVRFYGVNLTREANFPDKPTARRLADKLAACGYNSVRFHHHDTQLTQAMDERATQLDPVEMDKLDYLFFCLKERGIYLTTDLYVSRKTREVFPALGRPTERWPEFKFLIHLLDEAHQNWEDFAGNFLCHVNPYTGLAWKDDPALVTLSCVNEDAIFHCYENASPDVRHIYDQRFEAWLVGKAPSDISGEHRTACLHRFLVETQRASFARMRTFLDSLGCRTLVTDQNHWSIIPMALMRESSDFVDDHFYCDHPEDFPLPSKLHNQSALGDLHAIFSGIFPGRTFGKPYTISEFNWVYPNRFRAESGPLTAAYAALQDWDALYRYDYASTRLDATLPSGYFAVGADPINFLSDRIGMLLFMRGDVKASSLAVPIALSSAHLEQEIPVNKYPGQLWKLGFFGKIGNVVERAGRLKLPADAAVCLRLKDNLTLADGSKGVDFVATDNDEHVLAVLKKTRAFQNAQCDFNGGLIRSTTGEVELDEKGRTFKVVTGRSEVFACAGQGRQAGAVAAVSNHGDPAVVFVGSVDGRELTDSTRILVMHLTDALHEDTKFTEGVVEAWGSGRLLVRDGVVDITLTLTGDTSGIKIWALDMAGNRNAQLEANLLTSGVIGFKLDTTRFGSACMLYEIVR
jgi:hypothetical protein